jgi:hypothetical protein
MTDMTHDIETFHLLGHWNYSAGSDRLTSQSPYSQNAGSMFI